MLFPPLSHLEVVGSPKLEMYNNKPVLVVSIKVNINQKAGTIEEILGRRKATMMSIGEGVINDVDFDLTIVSNRLNTSEALTNFKKTIMPDFKATLYNIVDHHAEWFNTDNNLKLAMESIFYLKMAPLESLFSKMVDMKNKNAKQLLGTILADAARRGKEEICQALINKTAPSLHYEVLNWTDSRVLRYMCIFICILFCVNQHGCPPGYGPASLRRSSWIPRSVGDSLEAATQELFRHFWHIHSRHQDGNQRKPPFLTNSYTYLHDCNDRRS